MCVQQGSSDPPSLHFRLPCFHLHSPAPCTAPRHILSSRPPIRRLELRSALQGRLWVHLNSLGERSSCSHSSSSSCTNNPRELVSHK